MTWRDVGFLAIGGALACFVLAFVAAWVVRCDQRPINQQEKDNRHGAGGRRAPQLRKRGGWYR